MGLSKKEERMLENCYRKDKERGRALWKKIEEEWKWPKKKKSKWLGVSWHAGRKKWQVKYDWEEVSYWVGYYGDERAAAEAYDDAVRAAGLTKMKLNFPKRRPKRAPKPASSKGAAKKKTRSSKRRG